MSYSKEWTAKNCFYVRKDIIEGINDEYSGKARGVGTRLFM